MIPVEPRPEPSTFDEQVRQPGLRWIESNGFAATDPFPDKVTPSPYWTSCLDELWQGYGGICAYLGIFFEPATGAGSVDHYIAKSHAEARLAYEWSNYRLACLGPNRLKRDYEDVLDPFEIGIGWFHVEFATGRIYPNPELDEILRSRVQETIDRLRLDNQRCRAMRMRHFDDHLEVGFPASYLQRRYPFFYAEMVRQGLL